MNRADAMARASTLMLQGRATTPEGHQRLRKLEAEHPGVVQHAAIAVHAKRTPAKDEATTCKDVCEQAKQRWNLPSLEQPSSREELRKLVRRSLRKGRSIRAVGAAMSLSEAPAPVGEQLMASCKLSARLSVWSDALASPTPNLYRCESGRTAKEVIDDLQAEGLALANMGAGQFQGIVGAVMTATHGSGLKLEDMAGSVVAFQLVTVVDDAVVVRQYAKPGLFDPSAFARSQPDVELVDDADSFHAAVVSMGCLGIVYSVTLQAVPQYYLHETRTTERWEQLKPTLLSEANAIRNFEVLVAPWPTADANGTMDHDCLVTRRKLVQATGPSGARPILMSVASTAIGRATAGVVLAQAIRNPLVRVPKMQHASVTATTVKSYTNISRKVLQLNLDLNASGSELAVPVERCIEAVEEIIALAQENQASMKAQLEGLSNPFSDDLEKLKTAWKTAPLHTSAISMRFVAASEAWMSMAYQRDSCMIEMPLPGNDHLDDHLGRTDWLEPKELELYEAYVAGRVALMKSVEERLAAKLDARPHWGLVNFYTAGTARRAYPQYLQWAQHYNSDVFAGKLTEQLGLRP